MKKILNEISAERIPTVNLRSSVPKKKTTCKFLEKNFQLIE